MKGFPKALKRAKAKLSATTPGPVLQMPYMADVGAAPTQAQFNALLAALRTSGQMASS